VPRPRARETISRLTDSQRVEAFSDAVLAIAITLLALDLFPEVRAPGELLDALTEQWPTYVAYLASFGYLAVIWLNHHAVFTRIRSVDRGLKWANIGVLLWAATLPFPTAILSHALEGGNVADEQTAIALYALIGALLCLAWLGFFHYLHTHPVLLENGVEPEFFHSERLRAGIGVALYMAGGLLGMLTIFPVALGAFVVLPPFFALTSDGFLDSPLAHRRSTPQASTLDGDRAAATIAER
jgi:uncharacterized membrane protein